MDRKIDGYRSDNECGMAGPGEMIKVPGERPIFDTMCMTSERLRDIEIQLLRVRSTLFGPDPLDDSVNPKCEPSIRHEANESFDLSMRLLHLVQEIKNRLMS